MNVIISNPCTWEGKTDNDINFKFKHKLNMNMINK